MNPDSNCALCDAKLCGFHRIYFKDGSFISLCEKCEYNIRLVRDRLLEVFVKGMFESINRLDKIQPKGDYK